MRTAIVTVLVLAAGCCPGADDLVMIGEMPPETDLVLAIAQEHCNRPIVGTLTWTDPAPVGADRGYCSWEGGGCPMDAWVARPYKDGFLALPAMSTAMAHEIGHWCLLSENQARADEWARDVNDHAWAIVAGREPRP